MKAGTRIEIRGVAMDWSATWEPARIARQPKGGFDVPGYWVVTFADGGRMAVHESRFRVVSNAAQSSR